jgi:peptide/nickel transport system permease protein
MTVESLVAIAFRVLRSVCTLVLCVTLVFIVLRTAGDPVEQLLPPETPPSVLEEYRVAWGLDRPLYVQYFSYLGRAMTGDLGVSFTNNLPVADIVAEALPRTLLLGVSALLLASLLGLTFGIIGAMRRGGPVDRGVMAFAVLGYSMPIFFLGIMLILLFALQLRILPSSGAKTWAHLIMPTVTLALPLAGRIARFARTATLEVVGKQFIRTAHAKGARQMRVILRHALPNAMVPLLMFYGIEIGLTLSGAVVTEAIFAWPGLGRLLVSSVSARDLPVVQGVILTVTLIIVLSNLVVDMLHAFIDPKVSLASTLGGTR